MAFSSVFTFRLEITLKVCSSETYDIIILPTRFLFCGNPKMQYHMGTVIDRFELMITARGFLFNFNSLSRPKMYILIEFITISSEKHPRLDSSILFWVSSHWCKLVLHLLNRNAKEWKSYKGY